MSFPQDMKIGGNGSGPCYRDLTTPINFYRQRFSCRCPNNGENIRYTLEVHTHQVVMVEDIQAAVALHANDYHENIADALSLKLPGRQMLKAVHHGTDIVTWRGQL